jgi:RimJ/RimL family protein N-acetyltransferase
MLYRLRRIFNKINIGIHIEYLYCHDLASINKVARPQGLTVKKLDRNNIPLLQQIWNVDPTQMEKRLSENQICYISFINDIPAGYHWVQENGVHYIQPAGINITIQPNESWIFHVRVADQFQGQGISTFVYQTILEEAKIKEKQKIYIYTSSQNHSNQKSLEKSGFLLTRKYTSIKLNHRFYNILSQSVK